MNITVTSFDNTHTHTHTFNDPFTRTTRVSRYQKGFTGGRDSEWQWHQLGHVQVCTLLQADNHTSTPPLSFLHAGCPSCHPTNSVKAEKAVTLVPDFSILVHTSSISVLLLVFYDPLTFSFQVTNPSHCSLSFSSSGLTTWIPSTFTVTSEHIRFYFLVFLFCWLWSAS